MKYAVYNPLHQPDGAAMLPTQITDVPASVWTQLSAAERGYLLLTNIGSVPLSRMLIARDRQESGSSPSIDSVVTSLRKMLPVVEASSKDGTSFAPMDARRASEMRAVLVEIEGLPALSQAAE